MVESVFNLLKLSVICAITATFGVAIFGLLNLITAVVFTSIIGEVFALISTYLPFDAHAVFVTLSMACNGILSFLVAKKIFDLTSWSISAV